MSLNSVVDLGELWAGPAIVASCFSVSTLLSTYHAFQPLREPRSAGFTVYTGLCDLHHRPPRSKRKLPGRAH